MTAASTDRDLAGSIEAERSHPLFAEHAVAVPHVAVGGWQRGTGAIPCRRASCR